MDQDETIIKWDDKVILELGWEKPGRMQPESLMKFFEEQQLVIKDANDSEVSLDKFLSDFKGTISKKSKSDSEKSSVKASPIPRINHSKYSLDDSFECIEDEELLVYSTRDLVHVFGPCMLLIEDESEHAWTMTFNKNTYIIQDDLEDMKVSERPALFERDWILLTNKPKDTKSIEKLKEYIDEKLKSLPDDSDSEPEMNEITKNVDKMDIDKKLPDDSESPTIDITKYSERIRELIDELGDDDIIPKEIRKTLETEYKIDLLPYKKELTRLISKIADE